MSSSQWPALGDSPPAWGDPGGDAAREPPSEAQLGGGGAPQPGGAATIATCSGLSSDAAHAAVALSRWMIWESEEVENAGQRLPRSAQQHSKRRTWNCVPKKLLRSCATTQPGSPPVLVLMSYVLHSAAWSRAGEGVSV